MLGEIKGQQLCQYVKDYVVYDLETTGISCNYDAIIEISAVKVRNGQVVDVFSELVNPKRPIPIAASMVNNITDDMVSDAPSIEEVLPRFIEFIENDILVGHNICSFDMKFIYRDCERLYEQTCTNDYIDTLKLAKIVFPDWHHRRLSDLADYYDISTAGAHRALADCKMNQKVYELLGKEMEGEGTGIKVKSCPVCSLPLKKRNGRFGEFWGCTGYPECRYTQNA